MLVVDFRYVVPIDMREMFSFRPNIGVDRAVVAGKWKVNISRYFIISLSSVFNSIVECS